MPPTSTAGIDDKGNAPGFSRLSASLSNSARLSLAALERHLRERESDVGNSLAALEQEGRAIRERRRLRAVE
jgi:hypothetical protein